MPSRSASAQRISAACSLGTNSFLGKCFWLRDCPSMSKRLDSACEGSEETARMHSEPRMKQLAASMSVSTLKSPFASVVMGASLSLNAIQASWTWNFFGLNIYCLSGGI